MKKVLLTKEGKRYTTVILVWLVINFFTMVGLAMKNGTSAFPAGDRDEKGYFAMDHGKRYDFDKTSFYISYWQAAVTWVSFPLCILIIIPILYFKGHIKETKRGSRAGP